MKKTKSEISEKIMLWLAMIILFIRLQAGAADWSNAFGLPGVAGMVNCIETHGANIYIGGEFSNAWGEPALNIARWDGSAWHDVGGGIFEGWYHESGAYLSPRVSDLTFDGTILYASGRFLKAGGSNAKSIARWNGTAWEGISIPMFDIEKDYRISRHAFALDRIYICGKFSYQHPVSGLWYYNLLQSDGADWSPLGAGIEMYGEINTLFTSGNDLYVGGSFTVNSNPFITNIARWDGTAWHAVGTGVNGPVNAITMYQSDLIVGGSFTKAGGQPANRMARWDGEAWHAMHDGFNSAVTALASDGHTLTAGGAFSQSGSAIVSHAALWNDSVWTAFEGGGPNGEVNDMDIENNVVWMIGNFTAAGPYPSYGVAAYNLGAAPPVTPVYPALSELNTDLLNSTHSSMGVAWNGNDLFIANDDTGKDACYTYQNGILQEKYLSPMTTLMQSSLSATWGDYNNNGLSDLFICRFGDLGTLYRQTVLDEFDIITLPDAAGNGISAAWADYDLDGFLDLFVANWAGNNRLYHNNGDGTFSSISNGPVVADSAATMGAWCDTDMDGDADLFIANSDGKNNSFYLNNSDGSFTKITEGIFVNDGGNSWSANFTDYDNDGDFDLYIANNDHANYFYENLGESQFQKIMDIDPVLPDDYTRSSAWGDVDNNGWQDLFVCNRTDEDRLYMNYGTSNFERYTLSSDHNHRGCAFADYDRDGDMDLFVCNDGEPNQLFENINAHINHWLQVQCIGTVSNKSAIGAKVRLKAALKGNTFWQIREISSLTGWGGQNQMIAHFGLAESEIVDSLLIFWPSGMVWDTTHVAVDQYLVITEPDTSHVKNLRPVAGDDSAALMQNSSIRIPVLTNDSDADGDILFIAGLDTGITLGLVKILAGDTLLEYVPPEGYFGDDRLYYIVSDYHGGLDTATVYLLIEQLHINSPPVAAADSISLIQNSSVQLHVLENDSDGDNDALFVAGLDTGMTQGDVIQLPGDTILYYMPPFDFTGADRFYYIITDKHGGLDTAEVILSVIPITAIRFKSAIPCFYALNQNYPNPFNASTAIRYQLPAFSKVRMLLFDITGHEVKTLIMDQQDAGYYTFLFDASQLPSGLYFYRLQTETFTQVKKMMLIR